MSAQPVSGGLPASRMPDCVYVQAGARHAALFVDLGGASCVAPVGLVRSQDEDCRQQSACQSSA